MINNIIAQLAQHLNQALKRQANADDDLVVVCNLYQPDGTVVEQATNKLNVFLVNMERDGMASPAMRNPNMVRRASPPVGLNLMVMFAANFSGSHYAQALTLLSGTVEFFQRQPVFTQQNMTGLDPRVDKVTVEILDLGLADLSRLWSMFGGRHMPSVLYRVRGLVFDDYPTDIQRAAVPLSEIGVRP